MVVVDKLRRIFDKGTKIRLIILLLGIIVGAVLEVLALALIAPLITILFDSSAVYDSAITIWVYNYFGFSRVELFLAFLTFTLAGVYIVRGVYLYFLNRTQFKFLARRQVALSNRLLKKILGFSYIYHSNHNLAELQRIVLTDVMELFRLVVNIVLMTTDFFMMLFIMVYLTIISPIMTLFIVILALVCVLLYLKAFRNTIRDAGDKTRTASIVMTKTVNQGLGSIKEVKMMRREEYFNSVFQKFSDVFVEANTRYQTLNVLPKLAIEGVCFGGAFLILGVALLLDVDVAGLAAQLGAFVFAAFRILPAIARIVSQYNNVLFYHPSVNAVHNSLFEEEDIFARPLANLSDISYCGNGIQTVNVSYRYPNVESTVLENVNIVIPENKSIAFVGQSGAGKTTLADLILGILIPDVGGVFYNGNSIHHNFEEWSKNVGYIPQQIYLLDETITENIAFGIHVEDIDEAMVWRALEQAQLADFVKSLPDGLNTVVGDRGIRLSGGQRQRIGIARAMYSDPPILVLDEATSSLDSDTEKAVMEAVMGFHGSKTMLIVAHRLSTIEHCDIVYRVENKVVTRER